MRIWRVLQARKRLGQAHQIDQVLLHRPPGNLLVFCPTCPEIYVNMEDGWESTPTHLRLVSFLNRVPNFVVTIHCTRHLNQMLHTADGNHHANKFSKNSDPDDISLFDGKGTFPEDSEFRKYIKNLPAGEALEEVR